MKHVTCTTLRQLPVHFVSPVPSCIYADTRYSARNGETSLVSQDDEVSKGQEHKHISPSGSCLQQIKVT